MDSLSKLFGGKSDLPLAVVQYKRDDFGVGTEENLHWAIVAVSSNKSGTIVGAVWQVINRKYSDGRGLVWELSHRTQVELNKSSKCLGGVIIGSIKGKDVEKLNTVRPTFLPLYSCSDPANLLSRSLSRAIICRRSSPRAGTAGPG